MNPKLLFLTVFLTAVILSPSCKRRSYASSTANQYDTLSFTNPVIRHNCPDPSILDNRERDGFFYVYSTQGKVGPDGSLVYLPVYRSKNMVDWEFVSDGFADGRPQWVEGARVWAPDINYVDGKYILYYAMGVWGDHIKSASGVAVSDSPSGPFEDRGMIASFQNTGVKNSIDPNYFEYKGKKYLYWGSLGKGSGIWGVELSGDGLSIKEGSKPVKLAGDNKEGAYVHARGKWIYLFASEGSCCEKEKSTYRIIVGRSDSPLGPFTSKSGMSMVSPDDEYDQVLMHGDDSLDFVGPGHDAEIFTDDAGTDWMPFHVYWKGNGYDGRCMAVARLCWDKDGWPRFDGETVPESQNGLVLKRQ